MKNQIKTCGICTVIAMLALLGACMLYRKLYQPIAQELQQGIDMPEEE